MRATYLDVAPRPTVFVEKKIDVGGDRFTKVATVSDGLGREIATQLFDGAEVVSETRKLFDRRGLLTRAKVPRPGSATLELVDWEYEYDALGRMIAVREPSRAGCTGPLTTSAPYAYCGKRWTYLSLIHI